MLPNKMKISDKAFHSLKRFQGNTGITVNIGARLAFYESLERDYIYLGEDIELTQRELDKYSWLGEQTQIIEMLLRKKYPNCSNKTLYKAWAKHIEEGAQIIESKKCLRAFTFNYDTPTNP